jgi:membrane associated rhomboid family serine protease
MVEAPVGHHCPTCVQEGNKGVRPVRWTPRGFGGGGRITPVVRTLLAINVIVFLISGFRSSVVDRFSQYPVLIATNGEYYRLLTAAFLHAGILHIAFNMLALVIIGPPLEAAIGRLRFTGLYLLAALGGSVCSYLFSDPRTMGVGASGAIFGLFGAYFVIARSRQADTNGIVVLIVINLVFSFADPLIDWRAHIGGLVVGTAVAAGFAFAETRPPTQRRAIELAVGAVVVVLLVGLVSLRTGQLRAVA